MVRSRVCPPPRVIFGWSASPHPSRGDLPSDHGDGRCAASRSRSPSPASRISSPRAAQPDRRRRRSLRRRRRRTFAPQTASTRAIAELAPRSRSSTSARCAVGRRPPPARRHPGDAARRARANADALASARQLLALGATACLGKRRRGRDVLTTIHLASRGLHVPPHVRPRRDPAPAAEHPHAARGRRARSAAARALQRRDRRRRCRSASRPCARTRRSVVRKLGVKGRRGAGDDVDRARRGRGDNLSDMLDGRRTNRTLGARRHQSGERRVAPGARSRSATKRAPLRRASAPRRPQHVL